MLLLWIVTIGQCYLCRYKLVSQDNITAG